ncbi:calcium and integrin-binding family member 2-like [Amphibalanus amphitrite]|uniref:calcium and integrin-binding family member 2-like n=1 Tax=Amphibalanus amphitrite TaxID=1232801 RepID=UPI001C925471|nr:calcium and integrin-binding family member 2-like [Amphibalanus amphitrite]
MGNKVATFTDDQLDNYQDCTFFTRKEILRAQKRFRELAPHVIPKVMTSTEPESCSVPLEYVEKMPELRENPFNRRICKVFSADKSGNLTFNDFLNMLSALSEEAPRDLKLYYAFQIFDFDGDGAVGVSDLESALYALTRDDLNQEEVNIICQKILEEADIDDDQKLNYMEFEHAIARAPDFMANFHLRI